MPPKCHLWKKSSTPPKSPQGRAQTGGSSSHSAPTRPEPAPLSQTPSCRPCSERAQESPLVRRSRALVCSRYYGKVLLFRESPRYCWHHDAWTGKENICHPESSCHK